MILRKTIFWLHLVSGVFAGIVVLIMSVTGVALMYQKQITGWADKQQYKMQIPPGGAPLLVQALLEKYRAARPDVRPVSVSLSSDPEMPAAIVSGPNETTYVNPYTGEILGKGAEGVRTFFKAMTDWHRWLSLSGENRGIGRAVTGVCNFMYLMLVITGFYLWFPRKWKSGIFRGISWFRPGLSGRLRDSNWHYVFGFWCVVPLILIVLSGVVISYSWASNLVFRLSGSIPPARMGPGGRPGGGVPVSRLQGAPVDIQGLDNVLKTVQNNAADWQSINFQIPSSGDKALTFSVDKSLGGQPQMRSTITLDRLSGLVIKSEGFDNMDRGMRARLWMRFVHTGEYYGVLGQTIAGVASAAGVVLVWTGIALTFRRYCSWMKRRAQLA